MPRIALGSVVLRRACRLVRPGEAPVRGRGVSDAGYLVAVHAWRERHGLPSRCFLRTLTPRPAEGYAAPALHDASRCISTSPSRSCCGSSSRRRVRTAAAAHRGPAGAARRPGAPGRAAPSSS
ncbi:hypothetical protein GXW82_15405 [Streptacidiphilus sp. 4-A2]|nr:hypothetical protein [Streptacidiphilus sp. 4-A2]